MTVAISMVVVAAILLLITLLSKIDVGAFATSSSDVEVTGTFTNDLLPLQSQGQQTMKC